MSRGIRFPVFSRARGEREKGQTLVEFSLIVPLFVVLFLAIMEFAFAFNATLGINQASQNAALLAAEAGNQIDADCLILRQIELDVQSPADKRDVDDVQIQWTNPSGSTVKARNRWDRSGSTNCVLTDGTTFSIPYAQVESGYMESQRCNVIAGCPLLSGHATVDTIGVQIRYQYTWITPLGRVMDALWGTGSTSSGYTFSKRNVFRMEPNL